MEAYTNFASVYDMFMDNTPYDDWCEYIHGILQEENVSKGDLVLELGCGTGSATRRLADYGYSMIGIDNSEDMLSIAREKNSTFDNKYEDILYLLQDMRELDLYGTVRAVVSVCDSINYILEKDELIEVFKKVNNFLDTKGLFIFDINTVYKYKEVLADNTFAENRDNGSFIWENYFYPEKMVNEYSLTLYIKDENKNLYQRFDEIHYQKAYSLEEMIGIIESAGMEFVAAFDAYTKDKVRKNSERISIIAREKYVENKLYI